MSPRLAWAGVLIACALGGCGTSTPFYVEQPLSRTKPMANEAELPTAHAERARPPQIIESRLPSGMLGRVVERPGTGLVSLLYVSSRARLGVEYLPVFVGDALLAGAYREDGSVVYPVAVSGQSPRVHTGLSGTTIELTCAPEQFDEALSLLSALLRRPAFNPAWLAPVRSHTTLDLLGIRSLYWDWYLASEHGDQAFGIDEEGVADRLANLAQPALERARLELFRPGDSALIMVGDVTSARALGAFQAKFASWVDLPQKPGSEAHAGASQLEAPQAAPPAKAQRAGRKIIVGIDQDYPRLTVIQDAPPLESEDAVAFELLSDIVANTRSSSLMKTLRYKQTHAYYVGARVISVPERGRYLFVETAVPTQTLLSDASAMLSTLSDLRARPVAAEALAGAKARYSARLAELLSSGMGLAHYLARVQLHDARAIEDIQARFETTTPEDLRRVAARYLDPSHATLVVTGDVSASVTALKALGEVSVMTP
jgi:predicted Zn-dependent peptidase